MENIELRNNENPRNYSNPEPLNTSHIGRIVSITMVNGRTERGRLKSLGAYMLSVEMPDGKEKIVNKGAIISMAIL